MCCIVLLPSAPSFLPSTPNEQLISIITHDPVLSPCMQIGSVSQYGADSQLLPKTLDRILTCLGNDSEQVRLCVRAHVSPFVHEDACCVWVGAKGASNNGILTSEHWKRSQNRLLTQTVLIQRHSYSKCDYPCSFISAIIRCDVRLSCTHASTFPSSRLHADRPDSAEVIHDQRRCRARLAPQLRREARGPPHRPVFSFLPWLV